MITAYLGAVILGLAATLALLNLLGFPLGEFTLGGRFKILPPKWRIACAASLLILLFAIVILLQTAAIVPAWFPESTTKGICVFFAAYLSINTVMNLASSSKKEKYFMSPLSLASAVCYWLTALGA